MRKIFSKMFLIIGIMLLLMVRNQQQTINNTYTDIKNKVEDKSVNVMKSEVSKKIDWNELKKINKDICAWLYIPTTGVDYPVIKTKSNNYYLTHDIYNKPSKYGSIFFDARYYNKKINNVSNIIIYGHNMGHWNDTMFGKLMRFKNKNFYEKHKNIYLYTKKQKNVYRIVNVTRTTIKDIWYEFISLNKCKYSIEKLRKDLCDTSLYNCKQLRNESNHFITLSTCDFNGKYRILVIGEKIE